MTIPYRRIRSFSNRGISGAAAAWALCAVLAGAAFAAEPDPTKGQEWIPLFNGKDLAGWTPKIKGHDLGDNYANTFQVKDGAISVSYEGYSEFGNKFGHLFYREPFSNYVLRVEYRFLGSQVKGGPGWAFRNSGVMIHCQPPETMTKEQDFPV